MEYMMSFLEGIITFISPCLLPMIPIYLSYFAGGEVASKKKETLQNASGFVIGFTIVFMLLGTFASSIGIFLKQTYTPPFLLLQKKKLKKNKKK